MTPAFASNRPSVHHASAARRPVSTGGWFQRAWDDASPLARRLALAGALLALGLLGAFYSVVSHAVGRAESGRELARVAAERQVICSAFSATSSRDLCLLTVAAHATRATTQSGAPRVIQASYEPSAWVRSRPVASARID
jgi:hypothetical protein